MDSNGAEPPSSLPRSGRLDLEVRKLAHDLNNSLTVIQGNADLARLDTAATHPAWESVEEICHACGRARESVRQILILCHQYAASPLPGQSPAAVAPAVAPVAAEKNTVTPTPASQPHILLIDDEQAFVTLAERSLGRSGYRVTGFTKAIQAIAAFRENPAHFDLIICDLRMPGYTGFEIVQELLRIRPGTKVILISGAICPEDTHSARQLGVQEIMVKPDTFDDLVKAIQRLSR